MEDIIPVKWDEIKDGVKKINPTMYNALDEDSSLKNEIFHIYRYKYGEMVGDEDSYYQPNKVTTQVQSQTPFFMVLSKSFCLYIDLNGYVSNEGIRYSGDFINLNKIISKENDHNVIDMLKLIAGSRSPVFINIMINNTKHRKINRHLAADIPKPIDINNHFFTIKDIARYANSDWRAELLAFPNAWVEKKKLEKSSAFKDIIYKYSLFMSAYDRHVANYDMIIQHVRKLNIDHFPKNAYMHMVIKNIFDVTCGNTPAYTLANTEEHLPLSLIQDIYLNYYKPDFAPIIFVPSMFRRDLNKKHYFSLSKHTSLYKPNQINNTLNLCMELQDLFKSYSEGIKNLNYCFHSRFHKMSQKLNLMIINEREGAVIGDNNAILLSDITKYDNDIKNQIKDLSKKNNRKFNTPKRAEFFRGVFGLTLI